jgi:hypothetical protein
MKLAPSSLGHVLRDDCSVSVSFDGGDDLDRDGKPRHCKIKLTHTHRCLYTDGLCSFF